MPASPTLHASAGDIIHPTHAIRRSIAATIGLMATLAGLACAPAHPAAADAGAADADDDSAFVFGDGGQVPNIYCAEPALDDGGTSAAPTAALRQLTPTEYVNTVQRLFPNAVLPPLALTPGQAVHGFDNNVQGQAPSEMLIGEVHDAAVMVASSAANEDLRDIVSCAPPAPGSEIACGTTLIDTLAPRAFRRPLASDERTRLVTLFSNAFAQSQSFRVASRVLIEALLQAPAFLYRIEDGPGADGRISAFALASRVSYLVDRSMPDDELLRAAESGDVATRDGLAAQTHRLVDVNLAPAGMADFHRQWLNTDGVLHVTKIPPDNRPLFTAFRDEVHAELVGFIASVTQHDATLSSLLLSRSVMLTENVATLYGVPYPADPSRPAQLDEHRAGILTRVGLLAALGHDRDPSPVRTGVFVLDRFLCAPPPKPGAAVNTTPPVTAEMGVPTTNRERYAAHVTRAACASCHRSIDGAGNAFEEFDSYGKYRTTDNGLPVDSSGELMGTDIDGPLKDAVDLSKRLAGSAQMHACYTTQWWRFALGRSEVNSERAEIASLAEAFQQGGGDMRALLSALIRSEAFARPAPEGSTP